MFSPTMKALLFLLIAVLAKVSAHDACTTELVQERVDCFDTDGPCDALPIPHEALGDITIDPAKGYHIELLREGAYAVTETSYWFLVLVAEAENHHNNNNQGQETNTQKGKNVAIIDFPEGSFVIRNETGVVTGSLITNAIDEIVYELEGLEANDINQVQLVYSHQHFDHIGGATITYNHIKENWNPKSIDIIAAEGVLKDFEERIKADFFSYRAPLPTTTIAEPSVVRVGKHVEFSATPVSAHTDGNDLIVFMEATNDDPAIMMFVDVVFPGWAPFFSFAITTDLFSFATVHDTLLGFDLGDDGIFIGGHLTKLGSRADIELSYDYTLSVAEAALEALGTVDPGPIGAESGVFDPNSNNYGNQWLLFDLYFKEIVRLCSKAVVSEFGCVLAAVDVTIESACRSAQSFWRVDF